MFRENKLCVVKVIVRHIKFEVIMGFIKKMFNKFKVDALIVDSGKGKISEVKGYIQTGVNINGTDSRGNSALMFAANYGQYEIAKLLLENGANPNQKNFSEGFTPIFDAIKNSHYEVVKLLIEYGADLNVTDNQGNTPLLVAIYSNNSDQVTFSIIEANANVNYRNKLDGFYPIIASTILGNYKITKALIDFGANKNVTDINGITPLQYASNVNNTALIKLLTNS